MAVLNDGRLVRIRSNLGDYVGQPIHSSKVMAVDNDPEWPAGLRDLWYVKNGTAYDRPTMHMSTYTLTSWSGRHLGMDDTGNIIRTEETISPFTDWDTATHDVTQTEFMIHETKVTNYLHRTSDTEKTKNVIVGYEVDQAEGNDWVVEDMGPPPVVEVKPLKGKIEVGQLIRFKSGSRGDYLVPHFDDLAVVGRGHENHYPMNVQELWKVCRTNTGDLAFQGVNGGYMQAASTHGPQSVIRLSDEMDEYTGWRLLDKGKGAWTVRSSFANGHYLHRNGKDNYCTTSDDERIEEIHWGIDMYVPGKSEVAGEPDANGQYSNWHDLMIARP